MAEEKFVKIRICQSIKVVPESEVPKWLENQERVISMMVSKGIPKEEAEKYFKAEIIP